MVAGKRGFERSHDSNDGNNVAVVVVVILVLEEDLEA